MEAPDLKFQNGRPVSTAGANGARQVRREIERIEVLVGRVISQLYALQRELHDSYCERDYQKARAISKRSTELTTYLEKHLHLLDYLNGKFTSKREASKSTKFDYSQFGGFPD